MIFAYDLSFAYTNARVKAMKSKLFDRDRVRELLDVRTLNEFIELLEESPYKPEFVAASTRFKGVELVKHALDDNLIATFKRIASVVPAAALPLLKLVVQQWEINNIKKIIASKAIGKQVQLSDLLPADQESTSLLGKLVECDFVEQVVAVLDRTHYAPATHACRKKFSETHDFRVVLAALDSHYYSLLSQAMRTAPDAFTAGFMQDRIDFANALVILRMKKTGVENTEIEKHLVRYGRQRLSRELLSHDSVEKALAAFAGRKRLDSKVLAAAYEKHGLPAVEAELEKALLEKARKTVSRAALSMGVVVAFLHLKQEEVHSLRKIAYATEFDVKDEIRDRVLSAV